MSIEPDKFVHQWSAREFWHLVRFLAWEAKVQKDYSEIMAAKIKSHK